MFIMTSATCSKISQFQSAKTSVMSIWHFLQSEDAVVGAIRFCGACWYETSKENKSAALASFLKSLSFETKLSLPVRNAVILTLMENRKSFDGQLLLKSFDVAAERVHRQKSQEIPSNLVEMFRDSLENEDEEYILKYSVESFTDVQMREDTME